LSFEKAFKSSPKAFTAAWQRVIEFHSITFIADLDIYELEDILEELKELEAKNRFQEGDIISKSSNKRVKRKSGK
jgi:hypothetical protein